MIYLDVISVALMCGFVVQALPADLAGQAEFLPATPPKNTEIYYPKGMSPPLPEGTVKLVANINEQGNVESVVILNAVMPELDLAASAAVSGWQFTPATENRKPVPTQIEIDVVFASPEPYAVFNGVYRVYKDGVTPPKVIRAPDPKYTKAARKAKITGTVVLWLVVNKEGLPEQIRIQKSLDPGLDESAIDAVRRWKFEPSTKDGQPVAVMINVEVNFKLY